MNTRRIRFTGADSDFMHFATRSWSRADGPEHELYVCKRTGKIGCSCEDSMFRKKEGNLIPTGEEDPCKHARKLMDSCERIIKEGLEVALAA